MTKPILFSGIQPTGSVHIGNYLGAISQWVEMQKTHRALICIVDLHAITVPQEPPALRENTLRTARILLACGIDPAESVLFVQSHVPAHSELAWILNTITPLGELERMTQFKEKAGIVPLLFIGDKDSTPQEILKKKIASDQMRTSKRQAIYAGLLNYPVLMAADILLYRTAVVPVGEDQTQHIELARSLAKRFNHRFGETFKIPEGFIPKDTARIMGLDDPSKKMSKSASSANNYISLLDEPDEIRRKIKIAVTDSGSKVSYDEGERPAIANLMRIYRAFSGVALADIEERFRAKGYDDFKRDLADLLCEELAPIQEKYRSRSEAEARKALAEGASFAREIAEKTLRSVKEKAGLYVS